MATPLAYLIIGFIILCVLWMDVLINVKYGQLALQNCSQYILGYLYNVSLSRGLFLLKIDAWTEDILQAFIKK